MYSPLLSTTYAYDSQQVIYILDKMHVKVNVQRSPGVIKFFSQPLVQDK